MRLYLVSFDLNADDEYEDLSEAIDQYEGWRHVFGKSWFICSEKTAEDIYDELVDCLFEGDFMFICEVRDNYMSLLPEDTVEWMDRNID